MITHRIIIICFVTLQVILVFFYIYTQSIIIKLTYACQDSDRMFHELRSQKKNLTNELLHLRDAQGLKKYAIEELHMKKARLSDIHEPPADQ